MAQPPAYARAFSFTDYTANHPSAQQPGVRLDTEYDAIGTTIAAIRANLALIQRDDGLLANESVGPDQLSPELTVGLRSVSSWAALTDYIANDAVWVGSSLYRALEDHTSSGAFSNDETLWSLVTDFGDALSDAINAEIAAGNITVGVDTSNFAGLTSANAFSGANSFSGVNTFSVGPIFAVASATTVATYWSAKPTDYGAGKPGVFLRKKATATSWELKVDDGAGGSGSIDIVVSSATALTINGAAIALAADVTALQTDVRRARNLTLTLR